MYTCMYKQKIISVSGQGDCECDRGPRGKRGKKGAPGPPGLSGAKGDTGLPGEVGPPAPTGPPGSSGPSGASGQDGLPDPQGKDGLQGPPGPTGQDGAQGPPGPEGQIGATGLTGLQGPKGQKGLRGLTGLHGPKRQKGVGSRGPRGLKGNAGVIYTRWGSSTCPSISGTEQVYSGITGGSHYTDQGGGANYLCMPKDPQYHSRYTPGTQGKSNVQGTEYENPLVGSDDHDAPCAVCSVSTRTMVLMLPAKTTCPPSWTMEYYGYLMSAYKGYRRTMFQCVDYNQESIPGSGGNNNGATFHQVEASCSGLPCPPYNTYKELACVVCTK